MVPVLLKRKLLPERTLHRLSNLEKRPVLRVVVENPSRERK
jgi:hypothetical protein